MAERRSMVVRDRPARPWWVVGVGLVAAVLAAAGTVVAWWRPQLLLSPGAAVTAPVRVYADYLVSRDLALATAVIGAMVLRADRMLAAALAFYALIQTFDIVLDVASGRWVLVPGLVVLTGLIVAAALRLLGGAGRLAVRDT